MENEAQKVVKENAYAQDNFSFILHEPPLDVVLDQAPAAAFLPLNYFIVDDRVGRASPPRNADILSRFRTQVSLIDAQQSTLSD